MDVPDITIITPLAPGDQHLLTFIENTGRHLPSVPIVFVGPQLTTLLPGDRPLRSIVSEGGRAHKMNIGAKAANSAYLWFVHVDSLFDETSLCRLTGSIEANPTALHFFDLSFAKDGPSLMRLNEWGVFARSHCFGMPFGDQAFLLPSQAFFRLGGFDEGAPYGEDHLLVWKAHQSGLPLQAVGARVRTSARKYRDKGWGATTLKHIYLTYKQAAPELLRLLRVRLLRARRRKEFTSE